MLSFRMPAHDYSPEQVAALLRENAQDDKELTEIANLIATTKWQSGMESQHEKIVMDVLNLLMGMDIPFYKRDVHGNKNGEYTTGERLAMVRERLTMAIGAAERAIAQAKEAKSLAEKYVDCFQAITAEVDGKYPSNASLIRVAEIVSVAQSGLPADRIEHVTPPDENGIRRHTVDAREVVLRLGLARVVHDLQPNQRICTECLGLGILKQMSPYRVGTKPTVPGFPYQTQWIIQCPVCVMGKVNICGHCAKTLPQYKLECDCPGAAGELAERRTNERIKATATFERIMLADYKGEMLAVGDITGWKDKFIETATAASYLENHPDALLFACEPTSDLMAMSAGDIMERMQEDATCNANPEDGDDVLEFSAEAQGVLNGLLDTWAKEHVTTRTLWYPTNAVVQLHAPEEPPSS